MKAKTKATFAEGDKVLGSIYRNIEGLKDKKLSHKMRTETDELETEWLDCKRIAYLNNY